MNEGKVRIIQMYCPNCGQKCTGYLSVKKVLSMQCGRCRCVMVSKKLKSDDEFLLSVKKTI